MGPARRSVPVALRLLGGLTVRLLLLLLLCPPAAQGDCSLPPDVPNAHPILSNGVKNFPEGSTVTYKCNKGFVKVPGKTDSVVCLSNNQWSEMAEFCNRSCDVPPILRFALLKKSFSIQNYFPEGFTVEYECRQGYRRDHTLSGKLTCLQNFTWSKSEEFCKKKSCATPGNIEYGHVSITTDILYGASIFFSCNTGYRLVGADSSFCYLSPNGTMEWSNPLPKCEEISCPEPQGIRNGSIQNPQKTYVNQQSVTYQCNEGFTLTGEHSIYCTVKNDRGEWSGPPPECKVSSAENSQISKDISRVQKPTMANVPGTKVPSTPHKPTIVNVPGTEAASTPHKLTTINVPGTKVPSAPQKPTTINAPATKAPSTPQKSNTVNVSAAEVLSTPQKYNTPNVLATKSPSTPQKLDTINSSATETLSTTQKPNTINISATKIPSIPQKPDTINSSATEILPTTQKPKRVNVSATKAPSTPQKPDTVSSSATEALPTPQKPNTINISATKVPSIPQKPDTINSSATEILPTPQKPNTINISATKVPSIPQKPDTINSSATEALPTPQKPNTINISATKIPSIPQKPDTINSSATEILPTTQKPNIGNVAATKSPSTPQKPDTVSSSATKTLPIPQKLTTVNVPGTEVLPTPQNPTKVNSSTTKSQSTPQKLTTANDSATAKKFPISSALSTETPPAAQNPIMANASATQAIPATHRSTTARTSKNVPAIQKFTTVHAPVTKGFHATKRLTSAHITAKQSSAVAPRTTTHVHATSPQKERGTASSDANIIAVGLVAGTVIGTLILGKIIWHYGKSGSYYIHENRKTCSVFRNFTVIGDTSEVRPSGKF
ncbi:complement decay-accelerating factor isoform X2 [Hyaena hyaena]|uniref:complement decay-accelerating factor isoform X2 n=1 Tax=Hyaena hyaena TaxID=95912 RepID=UPI001924762F|nr:complement decay-accelerating factor isoform X2 [Hyaena hyaena]